MSLKDKATKLGIKFDDDIEDDDLQKLVDAKEKELEKENDVEYLKAEAKKAYDKRDQEKRDKKKLQTKLDEMEKALAESPDKDEFKALKEKFDAIEAEKEAERQAREEEELKKKTDVELIELRFKKELDTLKTSIDSLEKDRKEAVAAKEEVIALKDKEIQNLRRNTLKSEIIEAAAKYKALRPRQVAKIVEDEFVYDDNLEKYVFHKKNPNTGKIADELTVDERIKEFLEDEENDNLVESNVTNTSLQTDTRTKELESKTNKQFSALNRKKGEYDPRDKKLILEADERGLTVEEHIEVLKLRDEVLSKRVNPDE